MRWQWERSGLPRIHLLANRKPGPQHLAAAFPLSDPLSLDIFSSTGAASPPSPPPTTPTPAATDAVSSAGGGRISVSAAWVGHATVLVRMAGVTFITDPVFSARCFPVQVCRVL